MKKRKIIKKTGIVVLTAASAMNAFCTYIFVKAFGRKKENSIISRKRKRSPREEKQAAFMQEKKDWLDHLPFEELHIKSYDGLRLYGRLYLPQGSTRSDAHSKTMDVQASQPCSNTDASSSNKTTIILCIHGYHSDGIGDFAPFAPFYLKNKYIFCLVDDRAHGQSEGKYIGFGYHDRYDCLAWANELVRRFGNRCEIFLHGISMGAATVLSCCNAKQLPSQVKGIISDCAFSSGWEQVAHVMKSRLHLPAFPLLSVYNKVCQAMGGYNLKDISPVDCVKDSKVPILFIHGDEDHFVPTSMVYRLYHACKGHKQLLIVRGAAHAMSYLVDPKAYQQAFKDFIKRCSGSAS
ncbi:MAG TPA: alpha/beta hydrolase [Candidatus Scybalocola faecavium]|nr:alpha/beta hydrolase [Candidatus Scybalocola faecavium]